MMENKKNFEQRIEKTEEITSPNDNMDRFNKNALNRPNVTEIKTETKIDD